MVYRALTAKKEFGERLVTHAIHDAPARRSRGLIREHEILRIAATLQAADARDIARREVLTWAQARAGSVLPREAWEYRDFVYLSGGRNNAGVRIEGPESDVWALRSDDPDKQIPGRIWTSEVSISSSRFEPPRFTARLLVSTPEDEEELDIEPHTPGFVHQIADRCGLLQGEYVSSPHPVLVESKPEVDAFIEFLLDPARNLPIFALSVSEESVDPRRPPLDAEALARATLALGHVYIISAGAAWWLTNRFGKQLSVYGGGARVYMPSFSTDADPYAHKLFLANQLASPGGAARCRRWMRWLAARESVRLLLPGRAVPEFATIRNESLDAKRTQLVQQGASTGDQLEAANDLIGGLQKKILEDAALLDLFSDEHKKAEEQAKDAEERAKDAEEQLRESASRIKQLLERLKDAGISDEDEALPKSWDRFEKWCADALSGRVMLMPRARRGIRNAVFDDVELAARCLLWLANEGRSRRIEGGSGTIREAPVEDGIRNAHCGQDQYEVVWQRQNYTVDWHVKNGGTTRDPTRCLRIYYFWDPISELIVVADMPGHRTTGAT